MEFREWLDESVVKFSNIGEAMMRTLEFNGPDVEWIANKFSQRKDGPDIYRELRRVSRDLSVFCYTLSGGFRTPKIMWTPYMFDLHAQAIQSENDSEYESTSGSESVYIEARIGLFRPGIYGNAEWDYTSLTRLLDTRGSVILSRRWGGPRRPYTLDDDYWRDKEWEKPGFFPEFDGPFLKTPLELAQWVKKVVENTDVGGRDDNDNDDEPKTPEVPTPDTGKLVGV